MDETSGAVQRVHQPDSSPFGKVPTLLLRDYPDLDPVTGEHLAYRPFRAVADLVYRSASALKRTSMSLSKPALTSAAPTRADSSTTPRSDRCDIVNYRETGLSRSQTISRLGRGSPAVET